MLLFPQYFSLNVTLLNDSIDKRNCCNQAQFLNKEIIMKSCNPNFYIKIFTTHDSNNIIATLSIVTVEKSELTFFVMSYFHGRSRIKSFVYI